MAFYDDSWSLRQVAAAQQTNSRTQVVEQSRVPIGLRLLRGQGVFPAIPGSDRTVEFSQQEVSKYSMPL